jgi:hypothetical protein
MPATVPLSPVAPRHRCLLSALVAATVLHATGGRAQPQPPGVRLDVGSFTVLMAGRPVGREQFSVQRMAGADDAVLELRAEAAQGDRRSALRLEADSAGTPVRIALEERQGTEPTLRLGGQRVRGRFATLSRSRTGEAARDYLLRPGAVVVEEEGVLLHVLLLPRAPLAEGEGVTLPSLTPSANTQGTVRVVLEARADTVVIAGARRAASRWRVVTAVGEARYVWADSERRLLRVTIPGRGIEARRDDVPR